METPTHPLHPKIAAQRPGDEPSFGTALWTIAGFMIFTAIIFVLVIYGPW